MNWHCTRCAAPLANPPNQTCQACLTPTLTILCRHCGSRMSQHEDQTAGAHTMCTEKKENRHR